MHKKGLVHRDIKPSNIMVSLEEGGAVTAKIIDLGLAQGGSRIAGGCCDFGAGVFAGTPAFASPEQLRERSWTSVLIFTRGVTLWKMLTGQVPFRGPAAEVMRQHQHAAPLEQLGIPQPLRSP